MTDWDEVKRLAADFQKVQLSSSTQKLSERNCIEIVNFLLQKKSLNLIFTSDGKEYITPQHLVTEILGELCVAGGRINLVELAKMIGVDLGHINAYIPEVTKAQKDIICVLGQLIDSSYIARVSGEINEKLVQYGQVSVGDLTMQYDLPAEFIQAHILEKNLGKLIFGQQDKNDHRVVFTESFIARTRAKIRGALVGLTKPVSITVIISNVDVTEKLFFTLFDQASMYGNLTSRQPGAQYIPSLYARSQFEWIHNFYKQNGYLEFDALVRQGIQDYKTYLKKTSLEIDLLKTCAIGKTLLERIEADIEECIASKSHLDLHNILPSVFNDEDIQCVMEKITSSKQKSSLSKETLLLDGYILSKHFIDNLGKDLDDTLWDKARVVVESGKYQQYQTDSQVHHKIKDDLDDTSKVDKREERRKRAAGGKQGGGIQGRETKTKSTKNKRYTKDTKKQDVGDDGEEIVTKASLEIVSNKDISQSIRTVLETEGLNGLLDSITKYLYPALNEKALKIAGEIYLTAIQDRTASRRQTHNDVQNKLNQLVSHIRLCEKGNKLLPADVQATLYKYLLKSQCTEFVNEILSYISSEEGISTDVDHFNNDQRIKFINELKPEYRQALTALVKTLGEANIDAFMDTIDAALATCSMIIRKVDKKKDRVLVLNHKHALLEEMGKCEDPPLVLHLAILVVFISTTQCMIHASGRHLVNLLGFLKQYMSIEEYEEFNIYHDMVGMVLGGGSDVESGKERLKEKMPNIKQIATDFKKSTGDKADKSSYTNK